MSAPARVLVTGAGGFIGRWSVAALQQRGYEVHAVLSERSNGEIPHELRGAVMHRANLLDNGQLDGLMKRAAPSHLLHLAWIATPGVYWQSPDNALWLEAGVHLLRSFHDCGGRRAVFAGTCAEYDWSRAELCVEAETPLAPAAGAAPYVASKSALREEVRRFAHAQALSAAWARIFFQYGPCEHPQRLVPTVICSLLRNREALCSHGRQIRSFLHAADVGGALAAILHSPIEGPVNVGAAEPVAVADLVERIAAMIGRPELVRLGARSSGDEPPLLVPDIRILRDAVGFLPRFSLESGLANTIDWWRQRLATACD